MLSNIKPPSNWNSDNEFINSSQVVELIIQNGVTQQAWIRRNDGNDFELIEGEASHGTLQLTGNSTIKLV